MFASVFGTLALLSAADQALVSAFVITRFRGDLRVLDPGPAMLHRLTGRPTLGAQGIVAEVFLEGCRLGAVWGTTWHGALDSDGFRRAFLREVAAAAGRDFVPAPATAPPPACPSFPRL